MSEEFAPAEPGTPLYEQRFDEVLAIVTSDDLTEEEVLQKMAEYPDREIVEDVNQMFMALLVPTDTSQPQLDG